jgi:bifunctional UDP-N-acetylglucosamine pyrophosphorylase / glucosamine-1-phosphate N-acetyltransferase
MNTTVVILAAGLGTRMRSKRAKVLHRAGGLALIEHVVGAAREIAPAEHIVAVTGHQADAVESLLGSSGIQFVRQPRPRGTGHALAACRDAIGVQEGLLMVLYGDVPLLSAKTLAHLRDAQVKSNAAATLITTTVADPTGYGRVIVDDGNVRAIVEESMCTPEQRAVCLINSGIYCFSAELLWKHVGEIETNNPAGEYYLTDMVEIFNRHGLCVKQLHVADSSELLGINTRIELADADRVLRRRKNEELMLAGVTIEQPETVTIDSRVQVGADTVIEPFVRLLGTTEIGEDCTIGAGAVIESCVLADQVLIRPYCVLTDSRVETAAQLGPFSRLRQKAEVGPHAKVGNFVELKTTKLGAGSKSQHLAYLGNATIGAKVNVGAGAITCNYDGEKKFETKIGDGAFIGTNTTLVAPLEIGPDSYIGAGSVVTDTVPAEALALGRERQVNKEGWVVKRRNRKAGAGSQEPEG